MNEEIAFGAHESIVDDRTFQHPTMGVPVASSGGFVYSSKDIEHQHKVGICTAISVVQLAEKVTGKKYSPDFMYLLKKKLIDNNWDEGSSIFSSMKIAKDYGFLPIELFPYVTEADRLNSYSEYITKLAHIPIDEINRLISLCESKITGYASVDVSSIESVQNAISSSQGGIVCRYVVDAHWWSPSWLPKDIDPIQPPTNPLTGHAIIASSYEGSLIGHPNTWGSTWDCEGIGHIDYNQYKMTEAWVPYFDYVPTQIMKQLHPTFTKDLSLGSIGTDVSTLQKFLVTKGLLQTGVFGFFGVKTRDAVKLFQSQNGLPNTGYVGVLTRKLLNSLV